MTEYGFGRRTFLLAGGACLAGGLGAAGPAPVRQTTAGQVSGCATMQPGVTAWLGIPYAAPPVGNLRWKPPQPVTPWAGVRSCTQFGGSPWAPSGPMESFTPSHMDEDCLNLNVWAPPSDGRLRPVMVWIYGGAFIMGSSQDPKYDGARLAADGVVFVSVNYRVGILGSFAHPELAQESPHGVSGNYGLMDQVAALQWVRDNIARFGGDPDNVTIFGQSAGAFSVAYHLVMPASRGLFHRAVAQSGAPLGKPSSYILLGNTKQMEQVGAAYAQSLKAPSLEALRRIPAKDLIKSYGFNWLFYPAVDGWLVPRSPYSMMAEGDCARVPVMAGHNHDEGSLFPPMGGGTQTGLQSAVSDFYGQQRDPLLQVLRQEGYKTPAAMGHQIFGDVVFNWNTIVLSQVMSRHMPSYAYRFDYAHTKPVNPRPAPGQPADAGAFHGAEIGFVLKTHQYEDPVRRSEQEHLMQVVSGYWLNFAKTGSPNGSGLTHWPVYQPAKRQLFSLDAHAQGLSNIDHYDRLVLLGQAMNNRVLEEEG